MPLSLPVIPMAIDEFRVMPHRLGWKHEYWDGAARLSCQESAVASFELKLKNSRAAVQSVANGYTLRQIVPQDEAKLISLFLRAFNVATEYAGWPDDLYRRNAEWSVRTFFGTETEKPSRSQLGRLENSFVMLCDQMIVGAILIRLLERGPIVGPVMIDLMHHRLGLASVLLQATTQSLQRSGETKLYSRCHLGNTASMNWHQACGFVELPNDYAARHRVQHYQWQAEHYEARQESNLAAEAKRLANHWADVVKEIKSNSEDNLYRIGLLE